MPSQRAQRRRARLARTAVPAGLAVASTLGLATPAGAIANGTDDADTRHANAVVKVRQQFPAQDENGIWRLKRSNCTGTLVAPDVVLTAAHCVAGSLRGDQDPPHAPAQRLDACRGDWQKPGRWYPIIGDIPQIPDQNRGFVQVALGANAGVARSISVTEYSVPVCADAMLLRLEQRVPRSEAIPAPVLANFGDSEGTADAAKLDGERFKVAGWGLAEANRNPLRRQKAEATYRSHNGAKMYVDVANGASIRGGDSGSPLLWTSPSGVRYVVGVAQGYNGPSIGRYTPTFRGPLDNGAPAVSAFFSKAAPEALECPAAYGRSRKVTLGSWWSKGRKDNMLTATPSFAGCHSAVRSPDYAYYRTEGYLFDPDQPQPDGTVPLHRWYDPDTGDNFTTTLFQWHGTHGKPLGSYRFSAREGYLYDPDKPQPPFTRPLYTWYSPERGDRWTTTQHAGHGAAGAELTPDYRFTRLEGYVPIW